MDFVNCLLLEQAAVMFQGACAVCGMNATDPHYWDHHVDLLANA